MEAQHTLLHEKLVEQCNVSTVMALMEDPKAATLGEGIGPVPVLGCQLPLTSPQYYIRQSLKLPRGHTWTVDPRSLGPRSLQRQKTLGIQRELRQMRWLFFFASNWPSFMSVLVHGLLRRKGAQQ